jgi:hypothetical protein
MRAQREATIQKRLAQMLGKLEANDVYRKMVYRPKQRSDEQ